MIEFDLKTGNIIKFDFYYFESSKSYPKKFAIIFFYYNKKHLFIFSILKKWFRNHILTIEIKCEYYIIKIIGSVIVV